MGSTFDWQMQSTEAARFSDTHNSPVATHCCEPDWRYEPVNPFCGRHQNRLAVDSYAREVGCIEALGPQIPYQSVSTQCTDVVLEVYHWHSTRSGTTPLRMLPRILTLHVNVINVTADDQDFSVKRRKKWTSLFQRLVMNLSVFWDL